MRKLAHAISLPLTSQTLRIPSSTTLTKPQLLPHPQSYYYSIIILFTMCGSDCNSPPLPSSGDAIAIIHPVATPSSTPRKGLTPFPYRRLRISSAPDVGDESGLRISCEDAGDEGSGGWSMGGCHVWIQYASSRFLCSNFVETAVAWPNFL